MSVLTKESRRLKRRRRVRAKISGTAARPRVSMFRSNRGISAQLIDDVSGRTLAAVGWYEPELRSLPKAQCASARGCAYGRAREGRRGLPGRLRPRRLPLPRPRAGLRRSTARGGAECLAPRSPIPDPLPCPADAKLCRSLRQSGRPGPPGAGGRDQPRRQGREGRPALLVHGARGRRRRTRRRRRRLWQGQRGAARDPEGRRAREEGPLPRAQARQHDHPPDDRHLRRPGGCC